MNLSKSRYAAGLQCPKRLWLEAHKPDLKQYDEAMRARFEMGTDVGVHARELYPAGVLIGEDYRHIPEAIQATQKAVKEGALALFEAGASHQGALARADILTRYQAGSAEWDMIEVKSVTSVKQYQFHDMAIQKWIFEGAGYKVKRCLLCHIDKAYIRRGAVDWTKFFKMADISREVDRLIPDVAARAKVFLAVLEGEEEPEVGVGSKCEYPFGCPFANHCWKDMPEDNVFELCWAKSLPDELYARGITLIRDIPEDVKLNRNQKLQVDAAKSGKMFWKEDEVKAFVAQVKYPVQYLDFEADNSIIPPYDGTSPGQKIPFQYSLHLVKAPEAAPEHHAFRSDGRSDPRGPLADSLAEALKLVGSVVAYWSAYETEVLNRLAEQYPRHSGVFRSAVERMVDLNVPFMKRHIVHPGFHGSTSLKRVLPALVPGMEYKGLEVKDGVEAVGTYRILQDETLDESERERARKALLEYCAQDTMAMVKLLDRLRAGEK